MGAGRNCTRLEVKNHMIRKFRHLAVITGLLCGVSFVGLTGCAHSARKDEDFTARDGLVVMPEVTPEARAQTKASDQAAKDTCGAQALQYLVGRARTDIPVPLHPSQRRVVCSSCVMTQDFSPYRQTIVFDTKTGVIQSITCG